MRRIIVFTGLLACLGLAACDQNPATVQNAQPVAQLPPPLPAPVVQPAQQRTSTYSSTHHHRRSSESEDDSFYANESQYSETDSYDENEKSDQATVTTRDQNRRAVAHLWTDGFGRQHVSTSGEEDFYAKRAANDPINSKTYRDPWYGYDEDWKDRE